MNMMDKYLFLSGTLFIFCGAYAENFIITQDDIENGLIIAESGIWELAETVTFDVNHAIEIEVPDVILDLKGYAIEALEQGNNAITVNQVNCQIVNGIIRNTASTAISITTASGVTVNGIVIQNCFAGIYIANSDFITTSSCVINGSQDVGILAINAPYTVLENITITNSNSDGIILTGNSEGSSLNQITISQCTGSSGIMINTDDVVLRSIVLSKLTGDAIVLNGNNTKVTFASVALNDGNGCVIAGTGTILQQCTFSSNGLNGILLQNTAASTQVINCQSSGNTKIGINNLGATSNRGSFSYAMFNKVRDLWRFVITY